MADTAPSLHTLCGARVARISRNLVVKKSTLTLSSEAEAMKLVAQKTSIYLPWVYRSFTIYGTGGIYDSTGYIVMSYIDGVCLSQCWKKLLPDERENIIGQVAEIIRQLQSLHILLPGPIGGGPSHGRWFSMYGSGPFTGVSDFEDYCNGRLEIAKRTGNTPTTTPPFKFPTFVMTHLDITPRNLILDPSGRLYLIDWGFAGAYPPIFEAATIACESDCDEFSNLLFHKLIYDQQALQQLMSIRAVFIFFWKPK
jgi:serine/threonine protein kinase